MRLRFIQSVMEVSLTWKCKILRRAVSSHIGVNVCATQTLSESVRKKCDCWVWTLKVNQSAGSVAQEVCWGEQFQNVRTVIYLEGLYLTHKMTILLSTSLPLRLAPSGALVTHLQRQNIRTLYCSHIKCEKKKEPSKKYSSTLLLPKTSFPMKVEGKKRISRDKDIFERCKLDQQYAWQRENR